MEKTNSDIDRQKITDGSNNFVQDNEVGIIIWKTSKLKLSSLPGFPERLRLRSWHMPSSQVNKIGKVF